MYSLKKKYWTFVLVPVFIAVLDQVSKYLVCKHVPIRSSINIIPGFLSIVHVRNTGIAFGIMKSFGVQYRLISLLLVAGVTVFLLVFIFTEIKKSRFLQVLSYSLILGGAVGNLIDRLFAGEVTDFIDIHLFAGYHWPAFNVADSAITVGIVIVLIYEFLPSKGSD